MPLKRNAYLLGSGDLIDQQPARISNLYRKEGARGKPDVFLFVVAAWTGEVYTCEYPSRVEAMSELQRLSEFKWTHL